MFRSGPYVSCYRALTPKGELAGVRCVLFGNWRHCPDLVGMALVWYGEGRRAGKEYRQFGEAFITQPGASTPLIAHAVGVSGNGEHPDPFVRLGLAVDPWTTGPPERITLNGDLHEAWQLAPRGVVEDYDGLRRQIERGGPLLREDTVRKRDGSPGYGVRCTLSSGSWLGAGRWLDLTYLHIGTFIGALPGRVRYGAADICDRSRYCGVVPWGELTFAEGAAAGSADADARPGALRRVTGAWSEEWNLRHPGQGWTPDLQVARLTVLSPDRPT